MTEPDHAAPRFRPCPWAELLEPADAERWIEEHNQSLQQHVRPHESGYGVCFMLREGGNLYLQTSSDGAVILDVDSEAEWVAPLISAVANAAPPRGAMWVLPDDKLVQLLIGLSPLVDRSMLVVGHPFGLKLRQRPSSW